jgi:hypothetical protein
VSREGLKPLLELLEGEPELMCHDTAMSVIRKIGG